MPVREISTRISLDGEKKFRQAIAEADREMRVMNSELKKLASEYEVSGNAQKYFSGKSRVLKNEINQQKQIVQALEKAVEDSAQAYGAGSKQVAGYKIELNNAYAKLNQLEKQLKKSDREAKDFGQNSGRVGRQIRNGIGDAAEEADEKLKDLMQTVQQDVGSIRDMAAVQIISDVGGGIIDTVQSVVSFYESNTDYRLRMNKMQQSIENAGMDWEIAKEMLFSVAAITGDMDSAQEGLSSLANLRMGDAWTEKAKNLLLGAETIWQEALNFESLATDMALSIKERKATGQFVDLLVLAGLNEETYNAMLEQAANDQEAANATLTYFTETGVEEGYRAYQERYKEMIAAQEANLELQDKWAQLAAELDPLVTWLTETLSKSVTQLIDFVQRVKDVGLFEATFGIKNAGNAEDDVTWQEDWAKGKGYSSYAEMVAEEQKQVEEGTAQEAGKNAASAYNEAYRNAMAEYAGSWDPVTDVNISSDMTELYALYGKNAVTAFLDALNLTEEQKNSLIESMKMWGYDVTGAFDKEAQEGMSAANKNFYVAGQNAMIELANGINANADLPVNAISAALNRMYAVMDGGTVIYGGGSGYALGGTGGQVINLSASVMMDGQKVGTLTADSTSRAQGAKAARNTKIM